MKKDGLGFLASLLIVVGVLMLLWFLAGPGSGHPPNWPIGIIIAVLPTGIAVLSVGIVLYRKASK